MVVPFRRMAQASGIIALGLTLASCATNAADRQIAGIARFQLATRAATPAGAAIVIPQPGGHLMVSVYATGLLPGVHGIHLHAVGKCDAPGFTSAGPHLNPAGAKHGTMNPAGSHLGDMPNLTIGADGRGAIDFMVPGSAETAYAALFDADGTALVIHAAPDDYRTDPAGNSGDRIACGVLTRD